MSHLFSYNLHYRLAMHPHSEKENDMKAQIFHCHAEIESSNLLRNSHTLEVKNSEVLLSMRMRIYQEHKQHSEIPSPKQVQLYTVYTKTLYDASNFVALLMQMVVFVVVELCMCKGIFLHGCSCRCVWVCVNLCVCM